jgi:hypothetical protein
MVFLEQPMDLALAVAMNEAMGAWPWLAHSRHD